jgi:hypothetical protein
MGKFAGEPLDHAHFAANGFLDGLDLLGDFVFLRAGGVRSLLFQFFDSSGSSFEPDNPRIDMNRGEMEVLDQGANLGG